jgi:hypothetical protein
MATTSYEFKIISYNVLHEGHFDELSNDIIRCSAIDTTRESIDKWKKLGCRIIVCCREQDVDQLQDKISDGSISTIYILGINTFRRVSNGQETVSYRADPQNLLEVSLLVDTATFMQSAAHEAVRQGNNGLADALDSTYRSLLKLAKELIGADEVPLEQQLCIRM